MSYLIYTSPEASTGLIPQPGRAVNTFPSGLVRVDQTYLGLTANAATHRAILAVGNDMPDGDTAPCIDGLKIFPEAQERRREDGFTEYIVSAYGRANSTGSRSASVLIQTIRVYHRNWATTSTQGSGATTAQVILYYEAIFPVVTERYVVSSLLTFSPPSVILKPYSIKIKKYNSAEEVFIPYQVWEDAVVSNGTQPFFTYNGQNYTIWNLRSNPNNNDLRFTNARTKEGGDRGAQIERTEFTPFGSFNEAVITYASDFAAFFS